MSLHGVTRAESARRARVRAAGARRRAREKAARTEIRRLTLPELRTKFAGICQLCFLPVPEEESSIEHTVPISKGGADDETNQTYAHALCNSTKRDRVGPRKKGLRRRAWRRKVKSKIPEGADVF